MTLEEIEKVDNFLKLKAMSPEERHQLKWKQIEEQAELTRGFALPIALLFWSLGLWAVWADSGTGTTLFALILLPVAFMSNLVAWAAKSDIKRARRELGIRERKAEDERTFRIWVWGWLLVGAVIIAALTLAGLR